MSENFENGALRNLRETKKVEEQIIDFLNSKGKEKVVAFPLTIGDTAYLIVRDVYKDFEFKVIKGHVEYICIGRNFGITYGFKEQPYVTGYYGENMFQTEEEAKAHLPKGRRYWYRYSSSYTLLFRTDEKVEEIASILGHSNIWEVRSYLLYGDNSKWYEHSDYSLRALKRLIEKDAYRMYTTLAKVYEQSKDDLPNEYEYFKDLPRLFLEGDD